MGARAIDAALIECKREALENVLIPFTDEENQALLREAGFAQHARLFQWYNFAAYIAVKPSWS
jgi:tRNA (cmo5U34)-methyltransferase